MYLKDLTKFETLNEGFFDVKEESYEIFIKKIPYAVENLKRCYPKVDFIKSYNSLSSQQKKDFDEIFFN